MTPYRLNAAEDYTVTERLNDSLTFTLLCRYFCSPIYCSAMERIVRTTIFLSFIRLALCTMSLARNLIRCNSFSANLVLFISLKTTWTRQATPQRITQPIEYGTIAIDFMKNTKQKQNCRSFDSESKKEFTPSTFIALELFACQESYSLSLSPRNNQSWEIANKLNLSTYIIAVHHYIDCEKLKLGTRKKKQLLGLTAIKLPLNNSFLPHLYPSNLYLLIQ